MNVSYDDAHLHDGTGGAPSAGADSAPTGDDAVDQALTRLATLEAAPLREHVTVFTAVHDALQDRLADTEG